MENNKLVWVVENHWTSDEGNAVNIQVCATQEVAMRVFAETVADELEFWRNDLGLPITDEMLEQRGSFDYDYEKQIFTPSQSQWGEDLSISCNETHFEIHDFISYRNAEISVYASKLIQ